MNYQKFTIIFVLCFLFISTSSTFRLDLYEIISQKFLSVPQEHYPQVRRLSPRKYTFRENLRDRYAEGTGSGSGPGAVFYKIWNVIKLPYTIYQAYDDTKQ